jgi:type IV pilus assembly protein PilC
MDISDFFRAHWILMIIWFVVFVVWIKIWKKTPNWLYLMDKLSLNIPVFGTINRKMILSKFSRIFAWLSWSWVSVVESLNITSKAVWNEVFKQRLELVWEDVASGIKMRESLDWDKLFPDMMIQMIQVWEQTAKLDKTIVKVADFYDEEVDNTIWVLNKLLEPFIVVTLAIIVWFIAIAIMEPIMWLADTIGE